MGKEISGSDKIRFKNETANQILGLYRRGLVNFSSLSEKEKMELKNSIDRYCDEYLEKETQSNLMNPRNICFIYRGDWCRN